MLKKLIMLVLMLIMVSKIICADKYAVVITGDDRYNKTDMNKKLFIINGGMIQY
ncbi:MAG: hypothetical protein JXR69_02840 [Candidatus Delongbacteria bacterium]|nr:hypothetical protein [Candidatus Delongbacteria bacterium]